jgi:Flp pilus assembly pilin Flp
MQNEKGQTTTEYGLILMIVSVAVVGILVIAAGDLTDLYRNAANLVHNVAESVSA